VDLLLNLKGVVFDLEGRNDVLISLRKQGGGVVKASDFDLPHDVKVINPDHFFARVRQHQTRAAGACGKRPWICAWHHARTL